MGENEKYDWLIKLLVVGDSGVGKTNILLRCCEDQFLTYNLSTIGIFKRFSSIFSKRFSKGVDFKKKIIELEGKKMKLQIWDTAGQERFQTIAISYYKGAWGIILVYAIDNRKSFDNIGKWMKQIKDNAAADVVIILVGNKCDLSKTRAVTTDEAKALAESYNIDFYETSAKDNVNIEEIFTKMASDIKTKITSETFDMEKSRSINLTASKNVNGEINEGGCTC